MLRVGDFAPPFHLSPVFGLEIDSGELTRSLVVVFQRGLPRRRIALLTEAWPELDREGFGLVLITDATLPRARDLVPRLHLRFPVVVGPDLFKSWGLPPRRLGLASILGAMPRPLAIVLGPDLGVRYVGGFSVERVLTAARAPGSSSS